MQTKTCRTCSQTKPVEEFTVSSRAYGRIYYASDCKECCRSKHKKRWSSMSKEERQTRNAVGNAKKEYHKNYRLITKYGITLEQFNIMYQEQQGQCAICSIQVPDSKICVDHNHNTGQVRQLLCHNCNVLLGHAFEDPSLLTKCAEYLNAHLQTNLLV